LAAAGTDIHEQVLVQLGRQTMKLLMLRWIGFGLLVATGLGSSAPGARADNDKDNNRLSVTVAFGSGLNTLPPPPQLSGPPNHHVLPPEIIVRQSGVVHFLVSGFHMVVVYNPGRKLTTSWCRRRERLSTTQQNPHRQTSFTLESVRKAARS